MGSTWVGFVETVVQGVVKGTIPRTCYQDHHPLLAETVADLKPTWAMFASINSENSTTSEAINELILMDSANRTHMDR